MIKLKLASRVKVLALGLIVMYGLYVANKDESRAGVKCLSPQGDTVRIVYFNKQGGYYVVLTADNSRYTYQAKELTIAQ